MAKNDDPVAAVVISQQGTAAQRRNAASSIWGAVTAIQIGTASGWCCICYCIKLNRLTDHCWGLSCWQAPSSRHWIEQNQMSAIGSSSSTVLGWRNPSAYGWIYSATGLTAFSKPSLPLPAASQEGRKVGRLTHSWLPARLISDGRASGWVNVKSVQ